MAQLLHNMDTEISILGADALSRAQSLSGC